MAAVKCNCHENIKTADRLYRNDERNSTGNAVAALFSCCSKTAYRKALPLMAVYRHFETAPSYMA